MSMINIDREELIEMMSEYWACDNNALCWMKTMCFIEKYGINFDELNLCDEFSFDEDEMAEVRK